MRTPARIGYVVCPSYHGATLLALLLNNHSEISALGDTNPSRRYDQICACGRNVSACVFWQAVTARMDLDRYAHLDTFLPNLPWPLWNRHLEGGRVGLFKNAVINRAVGKAAAETVDSAMPLLWRPGSRAVSEFAGQWRRFYDIVAGLHGTSVVVDGSKSSRKSGLMARELEGHASVSTIHLVRDPRGFVASAIRNGSEPDMRALAWLWAALHSRAAELSSRMPYRLVRYEDLAASPEASSASLLEFLRVAPESVIAPPRYPEKHHLMGNAMLFTFDGRVVADERWRRDLAAGDQVKVLKCAGELAARFGYQ